MAATAQEARRELVSVIIPTYRRPEMLRQAVASVLKQEVPPTFDLEVVIGISDPSHLQDTEVAEELAADPRVLVALGPARGSGATRNAAMKIARGSLLAFIDDDCVAQPGWLAAGLQALESADLVQGRTQPAGDVPRFHHSVWVEPPSWLWEACNLFVRRNAAKGVGGFDEAWFWAGRPAAPFGEDCEWGWRLVRAGARPAFVPEATVHHAVTARDFRGYLAYRAGLRHFPRLFRSTPEARRIFYLGHFVNRRHLVLTGSLALTAAAGGAAAIGARRTAWALTILAFVGYFAPLRRIVPSGISIDTSADLKVRALTETVEYGSCLYGSLRWRRLLL